MIRHEKLLTDRPSPGDAGSNEPDCATLRANLDKFGNNMWRRPAHYAGAIVAAQGNAFRGFWKRTQVETFCRKVIAT
jgi:hypothetical protein